MKMHLTKRILFCLLAFLVCFVCGACKNETAPATTEEPLVKTLDENEDPNESAPIYDESDEWSEDEMNGELLGRIGAWRGMSASGPLQEYDQYNMVTIKSKNDLDPYRDYLSNFTEEYEKAILEDTAGACVLIELTSSSDHILYGTASVMQIGSSITIIISADEVEDVIPQHTFFLLHFPEEVYNGEIINVDF